MYIFHILYYFQTKLYVIDIIPFKAPCGKLLHIFHVLYTYYRKYIERYMLVSHVFSLGYDGQVVLPGIISIFHNYKGI